MQKFSIALKKHWTLVIQIPEPGTMLDLTKAAYLSDTHKDKEQIMSISHKYFSDAFTEQQQFTGKPVEENPLWSLFKEYHKHATSQVSIVIEEIEKTALTKVGQMLIATRHTNVNVEFAPFMEMITKYRVWEGIYPAIRGVITGFERQIQMMLKISVKYGKKVAQSIPYPYDLLVSTPVMLDEFALSVSGVKQSLAGILESFIIDKMRGHHHAILTHYQKMLTANSNEVIIPTRGIKRSVTLG